MLPLKFGNPQFVLAGLPRTISARQGGSAVGRSAGDRAHVCQSFFTVRHAHDNHSVMQQRAMKAGDRGFLTPVLRAGGREYAANFSDQAAAEPDLSGLIK